MSKAPKFFRHDEMMAEFEKAGRVSRQELSLKALKLDYAFQARVNHLDLDNVKELHKVLLDGLQLAPIVVFEIDGKLYVGDGFHRCEAHRNEKRASINAKVISGATKAEAVEFATSCNKANHSLPMTSGDKKKAAFMLLEAGWLNRSMSAVSRHVGASQQTCSKWALEYCELNNVERPRLITLANGTTVDLDKKPSRLTPLANKKPNGNIKFYKLVNGKRVYLPRENPEESLANLEAEIQRRRRVAGNIDECVRRMTKEGLVSEASPSSHVRGGKTKEWAFTNLGIIPEGAKAAPFVIASVGRAVLLSRMFGVSKVAVLVAAPMVFCSVLANAISEIGVEFMTIDQFVEVAKAPPEETLDEKAETLLRELSLDALSIPSREIQEKAKERGIPWKTMSDAKQRLGVKAVQRSLEDGSRCWCWEFPNPAA